MNERSLKKALSKLNLGELRYFESIGSTNDQALAWATEGAPDLSLVVADEQTQGRGRLDRKWFTPKGTALAFSLILRPSAAMRPHLSRTVGLAALSIAESLLMLGLDPRIKWPNDVLLNDRKAAGILVETVWSGNEVDALVVGIGVNVMNVTVPLDASFPLPATSLEDALGSPPHRPELLQNIVARMTEWRPRIGTDEFLKAWEKLLAYRGAQVAVKAGSEATITGELLGLESDGALRLRGAGGEVVIVRFGDVSLRPRRYDTM